tara:strand:+ start:493 stop:1620 length:1128 start_codon:yes stop_codon:yes gene_type:complete
MGKVSSPSDFTNINAGEYDEGNGYYTTHTDVSNLLQIAQFGTNTTPTKAEVGKIIKRVEDKIDEKTKMSYRPLIYHNEVHDFNYGRLAHYPVREWKDYVGFIKLQHRKIQKILRLECWQGNEYVDLAGVTAKLQVPSSATTNDWTISLTVGLPAKLKFNLKNTSSVQDFYDDYGPKTTASQIADCINEVYPAKTAKFTMENSAKSVIAVDPSSGSTIVVGGKNYHVSDFFYASVDPEASDTVLITSLLPGDDGKNNVLTSTYGTVSDFSTIENQGRDEDFWKLSDEGIVMFRQNYPYRQGHSIRVSYVAGDSRVPASIHDAATKFVAAEVIRHDDNSILIAETGSNIDLRAKHDILIEEATKIIDGKKETIVFVD